MSDNDLFDNEQTETNNGRERHVLLLHTEVDH